jgi:hypothetical protein
LSDGIAASPVKLGFEHEQLGQDEGTSRGIDALAQKLRDILGRTMADDRKRDADFLLAEFFEFRESLLVPAGILLHPEPFRHLLIAPDQA